MKCLLLILIHLTSFSAHAVLQSDINRDGRVDLLDLSLLASEWLMEEFDMRLGNELITNGGFSGIGSPWAVDSSGSWQIGDGQANLHYVFDADETHALVYVDGNFLEGHTYRVTFEIKSISGNLPDEGIRIYVGTDALTTRKTAAVFTEDIVPTSNATSLTIHPIVTVPSTSTLIAVIDNVSVKEILPEEVGILLGVDELVKCSILVEELLSMKVSAGDSAKVSLGVGGIGKLERNFYG